MGLRRRIYKHLFRTLEKFGLHITPDSYYSPIPNTHSLQRLDFEEKLFDLGIDLSIVSYRTFAEKVVSSYRAEYDLFPAEPNGIECHYFRNNPMLTGADAAIYYTMIRSQMPKKIIEIGSGYSTLVATQAVNRNAESHPSYNCRLIAIEPYPGDVLTHGGSEMVQLIRKPVQKVPLSQFRELREGDILFIDSSHVAKIGSDVLQEVFRILPQLAPGVLIHFHDIFLPYDYNSNYLQDHLYFWNENYVVGAFLMFNPSFRVVWPAQLMHRDYPSVMKSTFSWYDAESDNPTSFWIQRVNPQPR